jgi:hypothetical protein
VLRAQGSAHDPGRVKRPAVELAVGEALAVEQAQQSSVDRPGISSAVGGRGVVGARSAGGLDQNGVLPDAHRMRRVITATLLVLAGCGLGVPTPSEIPIGGLREPFTRENLVAAREGMPGGLLEPGWLPDGFVLVHADFIGETVDLAYEGAGRYLHIWQTHVSPDQLGESDPVPKGEPLEGTGWNANPLPAQQVGRAGVVEYSARLADGRTVSVDSDLEASVIERVLASLYLRTGSADR